MGDIPSQNRMTSAMIINPKPGEDIPAGQDFSIDVQVDNLVAGVFTDPTNTYYSAPQQVQGGVVMGHAHVTVQNMGGSFTPKNALDATEFGFFKGINDAGNGNGLLSATVTGGLEPGFYRVCTINAASNHQPVLMPVAQRGSQDDCTKFSVGQTAATQGKGKGRGRKTQKDPNAGQGVAVGENENDDVRLHHPSPTDLC